MAGYDYCAECGQRRGVNSFDADIEGISVCLDCTTDRPELIEKYNGEKDESRTTETAIS